MSEELAALKNISLQLTIIAEILSQDMDIIRDSLVTMSKFNIILAKEEK